MQGPQEAPAITARATAPGARPTADLRVPTPRSGQAQREREDRCLACSIQADSNEARDAAGAPQQQPCKSAGIVPQTVERADPERSDLFPFSTCCFLTFHIGRLCLPLPPLPVVADLGVQWGVPLMLRLPQQKDRTSGARRRYYGLALLQASAAVGCCLDAGQSAVHCCSVCPPAVSCASRCGDRDSAVQALLSGKHATQVEIHLRTKAVRAMRTRRQRTTTERVPLSLTTRWCSASVKTLE